MSVPILLTCLILIFWIMNQKNSRKEVVNIITIAAILCIWIVFFLIPENPKRSMFFLVSILSFVLFFFYIKNELKPPLLEVNATQQNYWGISANQIFEFFAPRKQFKNKRIDIEINPLEKIWYRKYSNESVYLTGNFFIDYKNLNLTKIENFNEISQYPFYQMIFEKLEKIIAAKEISLDFQKILKENSFYIEYFLMDLWERYTQDINIGVGNLMVKAQTNIQRELVGALDNLDLNSVKRAGAALFYSYMNFKDRLSESELEKTELTNENEDEDF